VRTDPLFAPDSTGSCRRGSAVVGNTQRTAPLSAADGGRLPTRAGGPRQRPAPGRPRPPSRRAGAAAAGFSWL